MNQYYFSHHKMCQEKDTDKKASANTNACFKYETIWLMHALL